MMDRWQATRYFAGVLGDGETKDWNCLRDWGGRRIRYPTLTTALGRGGRTGSREMVVRDGELGPHGGRMRGRPRRGLPPGRYVVR